MRRLLFIVPMLFALASCELNGPEEREPVTSVDLCAYGDAAILRFIENPEFALWNNLSGKDELPCSFTPAKENVWSHIDGAVFEYCGLENGIYKFKVTAVEVKDTGGIYSILSTPDGYVMYDYDGDKTFFLTGKILIKIFRGRKQIDFVEIAGDGHSRTYTTSRD